jgi:DNA (cytosine-5)-methyltransferase 1
MPLLPPGQAGTGLVGSLPNNVQDESIVKTFADLFCGGGLGARGAVNAGLQPLVAVDLWNIACQTYSHNFPSATVLNRRIEEIDPLQYARPGEVDLLLASPECTNHSVAKGAAVRDEGSRETALHTIEWIAALRPRWFVMENVKEMRAWPRYRELHNTLSALGYQVREEVINAAQFGAPQARVRLFLIGGLNMLPPPITPLPCTPVRTVRDILDPDGTWPEQPLFVAGRAVNTVARARNAIRTLGRDAEFLLVYYGSGGERSWQTLDQPLRTVTTIDRFALVRKRHGRYMIRMLQPSELARAMSLPDAHAFPVGTRREKVKLCGNGICATVIETIVEHLKAVEMAESDSIARQAECQDRIALPA